tara:strand:+ start:1068 stop:1460 length:393 start_codon:yes stop_codon:yes gene_type:complete
VTIKPRDQNDRRTKRRLKRHGDEYDLVLEHTINKKSVSFGLLCKSRKTKKYVWFSQDRVLMLHDAPQGTRTPVPELIDGVQSCTYNKDMLDEYLDHLMDSVLSKRDKKKYKDLYEAVKANQFSLIERLNA